MKVIDLLNKIANEEKYPKIRFNNNVYIYHDKEHGYCRYYHDNTYICLDSDYYFFDILNDEVEIIEEDKKIEKINKILRINDLRPPYDENLGMIWKNIIIQQNKINEIIDKLEKMEENK